MTAPIVTRVAPLFLAMVESGNLFGRYKFLKEREYEQFDHLAPRLTLSIPTVAAV
jgi:hypothetical protein